MPSLPGAIAAALAVAVAVAASAFTPPGAAEIKPLSTVLGPQAHDFVDMLPDTTATTEPEARRLRNSRRRRAPTLSPTPSPTQNPTQNPERGREQRRREGGRERAHRERKREEPGREEGRREGRERTVEIAERPNEFAGPTPIARPTPKPTVPKPTFVPTAPPPCPQDPPATCRAVPSPSYPCSNSFIASKCPLACGACPNSPPTPTPTNPPTPPPTNPPTAGPTVSTAKPTSSPTALTAEPTTQSTALPTSAAAATTAAPGDTAESTSPAAEKKMTTPSVEIVRATLPPPRTTLEIEAPPGPRSADDPPSDKGTGEDDGGGGGGATTGAVIGTVVGVLALVLVAFFAGTRWSKASYILGPPNQRDSVAPGAQTNAAPNPGLHAEAGASTINPIFTPHDRSHGQGGAAPRRHAYVNTYDSAPSGLPAPDPALAAARLRSKYGMTGTAGTAGPGPSADLDVGTGLLLGHSGGDYDSAPSRLPEPDPALAPARLRAEYNFVGNPSPSGAGVVGPNGGLRDYTELGTGHEQYGATAGPDTESPMQAYPPLAGGGGNATPQHLLDPGVRVQALGIASPPTATGVPEAGGPRAAGRGGPSRYLRGLKMAVSPYNRA